jgi:hypothetical protein
MNIIETGDTVFFRNIQTKIHEIQHKKMEKGLVVSDDNDEFVVVQWSIRRTWCRKKDLVLINKGKHMFNKSALETGMFVKQRNGKFKIVLGDIICGEDSNFGRLSEYSDNLKNISHERFDIVGVYKPNGEAPLSKFLFGQKLTAIWEDKTPKQIEIESLHLQYFELVQKYRDLGAIGDLQSLLNAYGYQYTD